MEKLVMKNSRVDFLFRLGLSGIFLANSLTAWISPNEFLELLKSNLFASAIASPDFWIFVVGFNDALLFLLILSGYWRRIVAMWATFWLIMVIYVTGFGITDLIEHIGILALTAYYYFSFTRQLDKKQEAII